MCGIAGILDSKATGDLGRIAHMMASRLVHRGPDGGDVWADTEAGVALGHRDKVIGGVDIRNAPRWKATRAFVEHLKRTDAEFGSLTGPPIKGDPRSPVYAGRVSLPEEATVLEHLAALVGDHPNVTFSILDGLRPGTRVCVLEQVQSSEEKRAANAKDHRTTEPPGD